MIEYKNVVKEYPNGVLATDHISLKIEQGEFVYVVGPSGAGKSTFIKMMYHQEVPTSGEIKVNEYELEKMKNSEVPYLRRELGIVFQDFKLLPRLTVFENIAYALQVIEKEPKKCKNESFVYLILSVFLIRQTVFRMNCPVANSNVSRLRALLQTSQAF